MAGTSDGAGYTLVGADGGVFSFGDAPFIGSLGADPPAGGIEGMGVASSGSGYDLLGAGGVVWPFGPGEP
ncbi:MAG: hypothetical protein ACYC1D_04255 [Acidimicrobiales bacterium]